MPSTATDRIDGLTTSVAVKAPCRVATTEAVTLYGLQTVDGVELAAGDRVLVKNQVDSWQNGIYEVSATAWRRTRDFDGTRDAVPGTMVSVLNGTSDGYFYRLTTPLPVRFGTSAITWAPSMVAVNGDGSTKEDAEASIFSSTLQWTRTSGYVAPGDLGAAHFRRVAAEPSHSGKFRSSDRFLPNGTSDQANGGWWELSVIDPTPQMFGAKGDGSTNDYDAFVSWGAYCRAAGRTGYIPDGTYVIGSDLLINWPARGQSRLGTILKFTQNAQVSRRLLMMAAYGNKLAATVVKLAQTSSYTRAAIDAQGPFLGYVTCSTAADAALFEAGDIIRVCAGKNVYDADDPGLFRVDLPNRVRRVDAGTGRVYVETIIPFALSSDDFGLGEQYYNADDWSNGETISAGDVRYDPTPATSTGGLFKATTSGVTSGTTPRDDTGVTWSRVSFTLGDLRGEGVTGNDCRPLIEKVSLPVADCEWTDFTVDYTDLTTAPVMVCAPRVTYKSGFRRVLAKGSASWQTFGLFNANEGFMEDISEYVDGSVALTLQNRFFAAWSSVGRAGPFSSTRTIEVYGKIFVESYCLIDLVDGTLGTQEPHVASIPYLVMLAGGSEVNFTRCNLTGAHAPIRSNGNRCPALDQEIHHDGKVKSVTDCTLQIDSAAFRAVGRTTRRDIWRGNKFFLFNRTSEHVDNLLFHAEDLIWLSSTFSISSSMNTTKAFLWNGDPLELLKSSRIIILRLDAVASSLPADSEVTLSLQRYTGSASENRFSSTDATNLVTLTDETVFVSKEEGDGTVSRLIDLTLGHIPRLAVTSNSSANTGSVTARVLCLIDRGIRS